ncbi:MAG TPA: hypothetical protein VFD62_11410 [Pyrinomonadaceae bacterium]|nr:hypothetical protein [Pyrinomonadaceae bacterium]
MFDRVLNRFRPRPGNACFCTLAIHEPYRRRAQLLLADAPAVPWIVLTDEPNDFSGSTVRAIRHQPTGPMAIDFLTKRLPPTGNGRGRPAYHDKRFALEAALREFDTAIFVDADSRFERPPKLSPFPAGICVVKELQTSIADHLSRWGQYRLPVFQELAVDLFSDIDALKSARWCSEALIALTKDGRESKFFEAWARGAEFLQQRGVFTGEGGVIGLAAAHAGWTVNYKSINKLAASIRHESTGPKS